MVEIRIGILKKKCVNYDYFSPVAALRDVIIMVINTGDDFYAHLFTWSYTGQGLHRKAFCCFCLMLSIETPQMDCKFLTRQFLVMSNIPDNYLGVIPVADWLQLIDLTTKKRDYMGNIIESNPSSWRHKMALEAYTRFVGAVINGSRPIAKAA